MTIQIADEIVCQRGLKIWSSEFECPYCRRTWRRGGGKEGFVKSAANNHVAACWEIVLFQHGYVAGDYVGIRGRRAIPLDQARELPYWRRLQRGIKALIASRKREGLEPRKP